MNQKDRDHLEQRLLHERQRAVKALRQLEDDDQSDGDLTTYPFHLADEGTDTIEQEQEFLLRSVEGRLLLDIDEALRTLYKEPERYGHCMSCNQEMSVERLDFVPWAKLCVECQTLEESKPVEAA
jgi:DnaK suppressor protein